MDIEVYLSGDCPQARARCQVVAVRASTTETQRTQSRRGELSTAETRRTRRGEWSGPRKEVAG